MKFKYFLRGLGTGIIFTSLVCIVAFYTSDSKAISDKEVIERAKELGMVEEKISVKDFFTSEMTTNAKEKKSEKELTTELQTIGEQTSENKTEVQTTETVTEEQKTETKTEISTKNEAETNDTKKTVDITIKGGMSSYPVCQRLQELGVIEDASDFDDYLIKNGYANRISVGTHTLTIGMSYEEIAIAISDPR